MKVGGVIIIAYYGVAEKKFFETNMICWVLERNMEFYLMRWDLETMNREIKQDGLRRIFQRVFAGIVSTTKLSFLGNLLLEISVMLSLGTQLKIGKGMPCPRFRSMVLGFLQLLFKAMEGRRSRLLDAIWESIRTPKNQRSP
jgi:hypothetical protein